MSRRHPENAGDGTYLGIDVGTSATKAAVIAADGTVLARARVPHPAARGMRPGRVSPAAWRDSVIAAVRELSSHTAGVSGIGLDTHCPTALLLDAKGEPLTDGVTWDHPGLAEPTEQLISALRPADRQLLGNHLMAATAMGAAHRLMRNIEPEITDKATTFGFVGTWLGQWLTGERAIDPTQASYSGLMASTDGSCEWLHEVLIRLEIPSEQLPPVRPSLSVLGELLPDAAETLSLRTGIPVLVGSGDTPAASYALGTAPGGRPLLIMGTTHVVSNALDRPDPRALALQRVDVRPGRWLINGVINGGDALADGAERLGYGRGDVAVEALVSTAFRAEARDMAHAPVFIPHTRPERGPLWFAEPRTALLGVISDTALPAAARGVVEGVLFADRMIMESCVGAEQRTLYACGAFGFEPELPQLLADTLDRDVLVVDESHLPAIGAAAMCAEVLGGRVIAPPAARRVTPRPQWREAVAARWQQYRHAWSAVTSTPPPSTLDEITATPPSPILTRSAQQ
ncbi:xylulose kinase [Mycolicibacterium peregrinum]|uniref:Xylulose kinase n=1 Tax=Mycolicibacterium peregrinum TaxID=43304 RepID=A0A1A0RHI1_MYCPR|nr:FGGY-family carbohydrate kinase [Mycolicibacterium peregrinum]OBB33543.1 xylulose kinase [Mycolicibacterium peregrinum]